MTDIPPARLVAALVLALLGAIALSTAAPAAAAEDPPSVGFISDSMGTYPREETIAALSADRRVDFYRNVNASTVAGQFGFVQQHVTSGQSPDILVIDLGTAEAQWNPPVSRFEDDVRSLLDLVAPHVTCVRWLDIPTRPAPYYRHLLRNRFSFNAALARAAARHPNVEVFHYATWSELADDRHFIADELHTSPAGDVEYASMVRSAVNGCDPALTTGPFWDVPDDNWAAGAITWLHDTGLATGYDNRTYRARVGSFDLTVTRGQLASMLWRHAGSPTLTTPHPFTDMPTWLQPASRWLWSRQLMTGYPDRTFRPDRPITRAETTRLLWRAAGAPTGHPPHPFTDIPPWLDTAAVDWIAATTIATGYPDNTYRPQRHLTRAQIARILHNYDTATTAIPPVRTSPSTTTAPTTTAPAVPTAPPTTATPPIGGGPEPTMPIPTTTTTAPAP